MYVLSASAEDVAAAGAAVDAATAGADILLQPGVRAAIDRQVAAEDAVVRPGAEVAFFSLFSGG